MTSPALDQKALAAAQPWPLFGYAPGDYMCHCALCSKEFIGDKRAVMCLECAASAANRQIADQRAAELTAAALPASEPVATPDTRDIAAAIGIVAGASFDLGLQEPGRMKLIDEAVGVLWRAIQSGSLYDALPTPEPVAWIAGDGSQTHWRVWKDGECTWTDDREKATRFSRREDVEAVHAEDDDVWAIVPLYASPPSHQGLREAVETLRFNANHIFAEDDKDDALAMLEIMRSVIVDVANKLEAAL